MNDFYYLIELIEENNEFYGAMGASWNSWQDVEQMIETYQINYTKSDTSKIQLTEQERLILSRSITTNGKSLKFDLKKLQERYQHESEREY